MSILKVGVLAVAGVLLAVQFKNGKTEYSIYISVVLGILIFGGILGYLEILIHAFDKLEEDLDLDYAYVAILLKMLGITYVSEICGIRDAFFVLLYGVTYWEKCLCITAAIRYKR